MHHDGDGEVPGKPGWFNPHGTAHKWRPGGKLPDDLDRFRESL